MQIKSIVHIIRGPFLFATLFLLSVSVSMGQPTNPENGGTRTMAGKTVLITGSTDGLGREVALRLGAFGAHVLVHGRSEQRGVEVVEAINNSGGSAKFYRADFGSLDNVRKLADAIARDHQHLNVLINNAGIGPGFAGGKRQLSDDGYEMIFQVNYLSHYLLTELLLPTLKASAPARIINVASGAQRPVNFDNVMLENRFSGGVAYSQSKLAQILHTFYLADLLEGTGVSINTLHPATMMDTTMVSQMNRPARTTVDEGARAVMNLVVSPELEGKTGLYFNRLSEDRAHDQAYDENARERLDTISRQLVNLPPR
jgi:NAD(P)-dependent dehydrogenase (short-subunit alcohol dehydrogenase family)